MEPSGAHAGPSVRPPLIFAARVKTSSSFAPCGTMASPVGAGTSAPNSGPADTMTNIIVSWIRMGHLAVWGSSVEFVVIRNALLVIAFHQTDFARWVGGIERSTVRAAGC